MSITKEIPSGYYISQFIQNWHDNENQLEHLARIWLRNDIYSRYNCFVIAPQFGERSSNYTENNEGTLVSKPSEDVLALPELIKK